MRCRILFITGIMGLAIIGGIIESLSTPRGVAKKEEGEKAGEKEGPSGEKGPAATSPT